MVIYPMSYARKTKKCYFGTGESEEEMKQKLWSLALSLILSASGLPAAQAAAERPQGVNPSVNRNQISSTVLAGITGYQKDGSRVILESPHGRLAVSFLKNDMVRVRMALPGAEFAPDDTTTEAIEKQESDYAPVSVTVKEQSGSIVMRTDGLTVEADQATAALAYYSSDGALLTQNTPEAMSYDRAGKGKSVRFVRDAGGGEEHFFGLGSSGEGNAFNTIDWRNKTYELWLKDANVHAVTPLYYSTAGYGIYLHSAYHGQMSFEKDNYGIDIDGGELDYYFFCGASMKEMLGDFTELSGYMNMPPKYALGVTLRGQSNWTENMLIDKLQEFYNAGISIDVLGVEPGWHTSSYPCTYAWSGAFPNPQQFVDRVHALGARVNLWEHPYVSPQSEIYDEMLPYSINGSELYPRADFGDGGMRYGFGGLIPDFTQSAAKEIYWKIHNKNLASIGVDGFKIDETDSWSGPNDAEVVWPSGMTSNQYHNLLGTLTTNLIHEKYKDEYNRRTYVFSRGNYTGMQKYATTAYTDYYGFDQFLRAVLVQSFSGTYFTPELRSVSTSNSVDYQRRMQMMLLTPFSMFNEWADGNTVLGRAQPVIDNAVKYVGLHYALIPYMYSLFWEQHNTGVPVVRPMLMEFWSDESTIGIDDQFMLGSSLLVAPVSSTAFYATRSIYLPEGCRWMDYNNGYVYEGGQTIQYTSHCSVLPLFVRMGAIIPMAGKGRNTEDKSDPNLYLDLYPSDQESSFTLFEDDGISYDYEQGAYCTTEFTTQRAKGMLKAVIGERKAPSDAQKSYRPESRSMVLQMHYRGKPTDVSNNGVQLAEVSEAAFGAAPGGVWTYSEEKQVLYVKLYDNGRKNTVTALVPEEEPQPDSPPIPGLEGYTTYECESDDTILTGSASVKKVTAASNGAVVAGLSGEQSSLTISNIQAPQDGLYSVNIGYINGDPERIGMVQINGGDSLELHFPSSGGWSSVGFLTVNLELKEGSNQLRLTPASNGASTPDMDYFAVSREPVVPDPEPQGTRYEAEEYVDISTVNAKDNAFASAGKTVSGFSDSQRCVVIPLRRLEKPGPYQISVTFANPDQNSLNLCYKVNGQVQSSTLTLPTTASPNCFATVTVTTYLNSGLNDLAFYLDQSTSSQLEIDYITAADQTEDEMFAEQAARVEELIQEVGTVTAANCEEKKDALEQAEQAYQTMVKLFGEAKVKETFSPEALASLKKARRMYDFYTSGMVYGDIDGMPGVTPADALYVLQHTVGLRSLTGREAVLADVNLDEKINATDALYILQFTVDLLPILPHV